MSSLLNACCFSSSGISSFSLSSHPADAPSLAMTKEKARNAGISRVAWVRRTVSLCLAIIMIVLVVKGCTQYTRIGGKYRNLKYPFPAKSPSNWVGSRSLFFLSEGRLSLKETLVSYSRASFFGQIQALSKQIMIANTGFSNRWRALIDSSSRPFGS